MRLNERKNVKERMRLNVMKNAREILTTRMNENDTECEGEIAHHNE